jgi:hypothetical protein
MSFVYQLLLFTLIDVLEKLSYEEFNARHSIYSTWHNTVSRLVESCYKILIIISSKCIIRLKIEISHYGFFFIEETKAINFKICMGWYPKYFQWDPIQDPIWIKLDIKRKGISIPMQCWQDSNCEESTWVGHWLWIQVRLNGQGCQN